MGSDAGRGGDADALHGAGALSVICVSPRVYTHLCKDVRSVRQRN
jgi:hypothetical protein